MLVKKSIWRRLLFLLVCLPVIAGAQTRWSDDLSLRGAYRKGVVVPIYSLFTWLAEDYVQSVEISLIKQSCGRSYWNQLYRYPSSGLAFQYTTLGNRNVFGHGISAYPFYMIPLFEAGGFSIANKGGLGLGIVNKIFDAQTNLHNVAMGSYLNIHFNFELIAQYQAGDKLAAFTGLSFDHLSNGNFAEPNLGINYVTLQAGGQYLLGKKSQRITHTLPSYTPSNESSWILSAGLKHGRGLQSRKFFASSLSFEWKRKWWRAFAPGIGADLFFDAATRSEMSLFGERDHRRIDSFKSGIHLSQEVICGQFSVSLQEGLYVGLTEKVFDQKMYNRLIVRHRIGRDFFCQLAMRSHLAVLDVVEFGIGYSKRK